MLYHCIQVDGDSYFTCPQYNETENAHKSSIVCKAWPGKATVSGIESALSQGEVAAGAHLRVWFALMCACAWLCVCVLLKVTCMFNHACSLLHITYNRFRVLVATRVVSVYVQCVGVCVLG